MSSDDELLAQLDAPEPTRWDPEAKPVLLGTVTAVEHRTTRFGDRVVLVLRDKGGTSWEILCGHAALMHAVQRAAPQAGDKLAVKWLGVVEPENGGQSYNAYRVVSSRKVPARYDWDRQPEPATPGPERKPAHSSWDDAWPSSPPSPDGEPPF
jgi:hypothetical protein